MKLLFPSAIVKNGIATVLLQLLFSADRCEKAIHLCGSDQEKSRMRLALA
jgi:hypothetical protein